MWKRKNHRYFSAVSLIAMGLLLSNCQVDPITLLEYPLHPRSGKSPPVQGDVRDAKENWWDYFQDPVLNDLIDTALENNRDLFAAYERIVQAKAMAGESFSDLLPEVSFRPYFHDESSFIGV